MIKNGHDFLEFLHRIREEDSEKLKGMSNEEYVALLQKEARAVLDEAGYTVRPAPDGLGNLVVKAKES
ncbi:MAG: hypothetical protein A3G35_09340 [candidate division NC10 bacterium RIFCSPLOWO2_12_FULL_66_18]|nr:MAG: hypothetical protein A3H39_11385 [candidate division NC10 bacterium RIFCSPLOWO2_02_FULL_66_22]OGB96446.1 MAG: hypothetical protein A3G35_09340 [candidate division NC10 bacterium RIFCSPLOWO2_12_FULL_66_18]